MPQSRSPFSLTVPRGLERLEERDVPAVGFRFDYSLDTSGFFNDPARREALEASGRRLTAQFGDTLAAVTPSGGNSWTPSFNNPATGTSVSLPGLSVAAGEVIVYVNGAELQPGELGLTNTGGFTATGTPGWLDTVRGRGQAGSLATPKTDFSTWGGMVSFDERSNWNFGANGPDSTQFDFQSVATHELMHVLGFGLGEPAFTQHISGGRLNGPRVSAETGGAGAAVVGSPLDHFAPGVVSGGQPSPMQAALPQGERRLATPLDFAALADIGWGVGGADQSQSAAVSVEPERPAVEAPAEVARPAAALGGRTEARLIAADGGTARAIAPFGPEFAGGVRVAVADLTGDGVLDLVAGTGPGVTAQVRAYDGATGNFLAAVTPFEPSFAGGVNVALGDLTGDGRADLVITPDQSGGPVVSVYDGASVAAGQSAKLSHFWGLADPAYRGGLRPAVGDLNADGVPDLALAAGAGGGPRVALLDGVAARANRAASLAPDFFAFDSTTRGGASVAFADADGDGQMDLIAGSGTGSGPRVTAFAGGELMRGVRQTLADFAVGDAAGRTGVRLASADMDGDGRPDVIASTRGGAYLYKSAPGLPLAWPLPASGLDEAGAANVG